MVDADAEKWTLHGAVLILNDRCVCSRHAAKRPQFAYTEIELRLHSLWLCK